jgi:DMSO/TMAO reductase YedYZ molybdopterin-dependent catalytic subunit
VTLDFPILSAGPTPHTPLEQWSFALQHGTDRIAEWSWSQFQALKQTRVTADIHCVTKWSKLDTPWEGVTFDTLLEAAGLASAPTRYMMAYSDGGYTTNLPVADLLNGQALVATKFADAPLAPGHGGPARLVVPHLYFWKSAKWVRGLLAAESAHQCRNTRGPRSAPVAVAQPRPENHADRRGKSRRSAESPRESVRYK